MRAAQRRCAAPRRGPRCAFVAALLLVLLGGCSARALLDSAGAAAGTAGQVLSAGGGGGSSSAFATPADATLAVPQAAGTAASVADGADGVTHAQTLAYARLPPADQGAAAGSVGQTAVQQSMGSSRGAAAAAATVTAAAPASGLATPAAPPPPAAVAADPGVQAASGDSAAAPRGASRAQQGDAAASAPARAPTIVAGLGGGGEAVAAGGGGAAAPAAGPAAAVLGYTTGAEATGANVGASRTVTLLAPRGGDRPQEAAVKRNYTGRATAEHPNIGLPGGTYSQPQPGRTSASQLAALQARPRPGAALTGGVGSERKCACRL